MNRMWLLLIKTTPMRTSSSKVSRECIQKAHLGFYNACTIASIQNWRLVIFASEIAYCVWFQPQNMALFLIYLKIHTYILHYVYYLCMHIIFHRVICWGFPSHMLDTINGLWLSWGWDFTLLEKKIRHLAIVNETTSFFDLN